MKFKENGGCSKLKSRFSPKKITIYIATNVKSFDQVQDKVIYYLNLFKFFIPDDLAPSCSHHHKMPF